MIAGIDVLKAFAITSVILYHYFPDIFPSGFLGVNVFLVVTGYLSAMSLEKRNVFTFLMNRFYRIYPSLLLLNITIAGYLLMFGFREEIAIFLRQSLHSVFLLENLRQMSGAGYFEPETKSTFLFHLWSISIEFQCWIFLGAISLTNHAKKLTVLAGAISFLYFMYSTDAKINSYVYLNPFTRFYEVALGYCTYHLSNTAVGCHRRWVAIPAIFALLTLIVFQSLDLLAWIASSLLACMFLLTYKKPISIWLFSWMSRNTYGLYLWHIPILHILTAVALPQRYVAAGSIFVSIAMSIINRRYFEK